MTVSELNRDQMIELKQNYLSELVDKTEYRCLSYGELAAADEIVSDAKIFWLYDCYDFSEDDFSCTAGN